MTNVEVLISSSLSFPVLESDPTGNLNLGAPVAMSQQGPLYMRERTRPSHVVLNYMLVMRLYGSKFLQQTVEDRMHGDELFGGESQLCNVGGLEVRVWLDLISQQRLGRPAFMV